MAHITGVGSPVSEILSHDTQSFVDEWIGNIHGSTRGAGSVSESGLREQCLQFLSSFRVGLDGEGASNPDSLRWTELRELLAKISKSRATEGFTPTETATFVLSFKKPLFRRLREDVRDARILADVYLAMTGGQGALALVETTASGNAADGGRAVRALVRPSVPLVVIEATEQELAAHAVMLAVINKASGGKCLWALPPAQVAPEMNRSSA